jgi:hypothetical protein
MNLWPGIEPFIAALIGAICGSAVAPRLLGDWWLEKVKADYSKKLAEIEHKLSILLSDRQNSFWMGINSHMATVLFDKHVDFCEEYVKAMSKALSTFIQNGKKDQLLDTTELFEIRKRWELWLYDEIDVNLDRFEQELPRILTEAPVLNTNGERGSYEFSVRSLISVLRKILAIEELTNLRKKLVEDSVNRPVQSL